MKILILSTYDADGSGVFAIQLMKIIQSMGHEAQIVCIKSTSDDFYIRGIFDNKVIKNFFYKIKRRLFRIFYNPNPEYAFLDTFSLSSYELQSSDVWPSKCSLIICTFLSQMINPSSLSKIRSKFENPPVIFYGVDMSFLTGGCHYARSCQKYKTNCNHCPAVSLFAQPFVTKNFLQKKQPVSNIHNHSVIASSDEHSRQIKNSKIFRNSHIRKLLMPVDHAVYGCNENVRLKLKLEYGLGKKTLFVRSSAEPRKGSKIFINCILKLLESEPDIVHDIDIVTVGDNYISSQLDSCGLRIFSLGYISDESELSKLYTASDVFINTSLADSGPMMLAQSMMSFTPLITTDVGLARDLVVTGSGSTILKEPIATNLAEEINRFFILTNGERNKIRINTRNTAIKLLSKDNYINKLSGIIKLEMSDND